LDAASLAHKKLGKERKVPGGRKIWLEVSGFCILSFFQLTIILTEGWKKEDTSNRRIKKKINSCATRNRKEIIKSTWRWHIYFIIFFSFPWFLSPDPDFSIRDSYENYF
jgi:hypothetical protein